MRQDFRSILWCVFALSTVTSCRRSLSTSGDLKSTVTPAYASNSIVNDLGPTIAKNQSSAKGTVEVTLEVQEKMVDLGSNLNVLALTYNGVVPGPLIVANVGDELIIHVKNKSKFPTILHPHGFVLPHQYDGTHLSQADIMPGGEFTHRFIARHPGTYWYHSHYHDMTKHFVTQQLEVSTKQLGRGLYGSIVIRDPNELKMKEKVLVISNANASGGPINTLEILEKKVYLINGKTSQRTSMQPGESQRYRIVNASVDQIVDLRLSNGQSFTQIGTDSGLTDKPHLIKNLRLDAAERADVVIVAPNDGTQSIEMLADPIALTPRPEKGGDHDNPVAKDFWYRFKPVYDAPGPVAILQIDVKGEPTTPVTLPATLANIPRPTEFASTRDFSVGTQIYTIDNKRLKTPFYFRFPVNGELFPKTPQPVETLGTWVLHRWKNDSPSPHPIHVHGFRFIVLKRNGMDVPIKGWKDTADLPPFGSLEYAIHLDGYPGEWMYHCHFESHMEGGFMGSMIVKDAQGNYPPSFQGHEHKHL